MLLDEDPATLIHECTSNFNLAPDKSALSRINSSISNLSQARSARLSHLRSNLGRTTRHLSSLRTEHDEAISSRDSSAHAANILALDRQKFRVAKQAAELEAESEKLRIELDTVRATLAGDEGRGKAEEVVERDHHVVAGAPADDEVVLRLKVYRSLGIDVEAEKNTGVFERAVVRNRERGDVRVVNIEPRFSRKFYADYFWDSI